MKLHHLTIPARLILLLLAVIVPAAGLVAWLILAESREANEVGYASVKAIARETAADLGVLLRDNQVLLQQLAERPLVRALNESQCDPVIGEYVRLHTAFTTLAVHDLRGKIICSFPSAPMAQIGDELYPWFKESGRSGRFSAGDTYHGHQSGRWVSVLKYPVRDASARVSGLLILQLDLNALEQRLLHSTPAIFTVAVLDRQDKMLMQSADSASWVGSPIANLLAKKIDSQGGTFFSAPGADGLQRMWAEATVPATDWRVISSIAEFEILGSHRARLVSSITISLATSLVALALAYKIASTIVEPVRELTGTCANVAAGDLDARAKVVGPAEVRLVAHQLNRMLDVRSNAEQALRESEEQLQGIIHLAAEAIIVMDGEFRLVLFNAAAESIFGCSAVDAIGTPGELLFPEHQRESWTRRLAEFHLDDSSVMRIGVEAEIFGLRASGEEFPLEMSLSRISHSGKRLYTAVLSDISIRKRDLERLNMLAYYDPLTLLANRTLFHQRLQQALVKAQRFNKGLAVLIMDLDRFKVFNDTLGHEDGDRVLQLVAQRAKECLREADTLARVGGDEFAVLIVENADSWYVGSVAGKLLEAVARLMTLDGQEYRVTASIGISLYPTGGRDAKTLLRNADIALHGAKERGKNNAQFYTTAMPLQSMARLPLETGLVHALERGEFILHYQPKVNIANGRITGMEALVRWMRPGTGMVSPAEFIPLAEETGLIVPIGAWVLKTACERNHEWQREGLPQLRVAVNLSARQFVQANLVSDVARVLDASGLDPAWLELEITESVVMENPEQAIRTLRQLKSMGIVLSIDDFGTGYSSLAYLKRFPIDNIKIDRSFIKDIPGNSDDSSITHAIINLTHNLRHKVIAEGVETLEQLDFLREHGCDEMQGYFFSRPLPEVEFLALVLGQTSRVAIAA